jgi:hypothetical protein
MQISNYQCAVVDICLEVHCKAAESLHEKSQGLPLPRVDDSIAKQPFPALAARVRMNGKGDRQPGSGLGKP